MTFKDETNAMILYILKTGEEFLDDLSLTFTKYSIVPSIKNDL